MSDRLSLGVDLGGTKILAGVISPDGEIVAREYRATRADEGPEAVIERIFALLDRVAGLAKVKPSTLDGVGIAAAGALDLERGVVTTSPNLPGWRDVHLRDIVEKKFGVRTFLINDANAAALGEHRFGAGRGVNNLIYITVSTGIGGGIIIGGELYNGACGSAGEIGHMTIDINGPRCKCGNIGCLETLASGTVIAAEARKCIANGAKTSLLELSGGEAEKITAKTISQAAREGDSLALELVSRAGSYLGVGMVNLINIFNPEMIIVGGGMSKMGDMLLDPARKVVRERAFSLPANAVRIVLSELGDDAGALGAAAFVHERCSTSSESL
jgi:glucokinase